MFLYFCYHFLNLFRYARPDLRLYIHSRPLLPYCNAQNTQIFRRILFCDIIIYFSLENRVRFMGHLTWYHNNAEIQKRQIFGSLECCGIMVSRYLNRTLQLVNQNLLRFGCLRFRLESGAIEIFTFSGYNNSTSKRKACTDCRN